MNAPVEWIVPDWPAPPHVRALITTRAGGVSGGSYASFNIGDLTEDDPAAVAENKRRLRALLPAEPRWLRQVHSAQVVGADAIASPIEADASYSQSRAVVCAVKAADCMPVLLTDRAGSVVGAAHCGWRGLSQGIIENTVVAMQVDPASLIAYLGPAIGPDAFEVGAEVLQAFRAVDPRAQDAFRQGRPGKWYADLFELGRQRLARAGVHAVYGGGQCTYTHTTRYYSHRRNPATGRMAALVWLQDTRAE